MSMIGEEKHKEMNIRKEMIKELKNQPGCPTFY